MNSRQENGASLLFSEANKEESWLSGISNHPLFRPLALLEGFARQLRTWSFNNWSIACLLLMLLGLAMRMAHIATESVYLDEAFSIWYGQQRLGYLLEAVARDTNPPLHFLLLKYWMELFGKDETAVRMLSAFLSLLTIPVILAIGRRFFDKGTALATAIIFTASDIQVYYSHEARTYTLVVLLAACSLWFLLAFFESGQWKDAAGLAVCNALLLYSHYATYGFLLMEGFAALMLGFGRWKQFLIYIGSQLAALLLFLPWLLYFLSKFQMMASVPPLANATDLHFVLLRFAGSELMKWIFLGLMLLGIPTTLIFSKRNGTKVILKRVFVLVVVGLAALFFNFWISANWLPTFQVNYVLFSTIGIFLLLGWIWANFPLPISLRWLLGAIALWYMVSTVKYDYWRADNWRAAVAQVKFLDGEGTLKLLGLNYFDLPMMYYYDFEAFKEYRHTLKKMNAQNMYGPSSQEDLKGIHPEKYSRVLLIDGESRTGNADYPWIKPLEAIFGPAKQVYQFRRIEVWHFEKSDSLPQAPN